MLPQIRISKTPKIKDYMTILSEKYPTLEESEIIKFLIGKEIVRLKENRDNENYYAIVNSSPSYGKFPDEQDADESLYSAKDAKPLSKK